MALIDLSSPVGLLRLRLGDTRDLPILPDEVYEQALTETKGNLKSATVLCGQYILATLAFDSQASMGVITVYGNQVFRQYQDYLLMVLKDPDFNSVSPIPYSGDNGTNSILEFKKRWDKKHCWQHTDEGWSFDEGV